VNLEAEDLASEITALETEYSELKQSIVDSSEYASGPFSRTEGKDSVSDADLDAVMSQL